MSKDERRALERYWMEVLGRVDPYRPLQPPEVATLYQERPDTPGTQIETDLRLQSAAQKILICGARGSGKSTELASIASRLGDRFTVLVVDLGGGLPDGSGTLGVLALLGAACLRASHDWRFPDADLTVDRTPAGKSFAAALESWVPGAKLASRLLGVAGSVVSVFHPTAAVAAGAAATTIDALSDAATLRSELSRDPFVGRLDRARPQDADALVRAVNAVLSELEGLAGRQPLVLADGLDKRTEVEDIRTTLADVELLEALAAPLVLTGPVPLRHDPRFRGLPGRFRLMSLPNVAVRRKTDSGEVVTAEDGVGILVSLLAKREVAEGVFPLEVQRRAAVMSSGIVREFFELLDWAAKEALRQGRRAVRVDDIDAAIRSRRITLQHFLNDQSLGLLRRVLSKGVLPADRKADVLLYENLIACYANGDLWYRPNELIVESVAGSSVGD